jgi:hypothetical protein
VKEGDAAGGGGSLAVGDGAAHEDAGAVGDVGDGGGGEGAEVVEVVAEEFDGVAVGDDAGEVVGFVAGDGAGGPEGLAAVGAEGGEGAAGGEGLELWLGQVGAATEIDHVSVGAVGVAFVDQGLGVLGSQVADPVEPQADGYTAGAAGVGFESGVGEAAVDVGAVDGDAVAAGVGYSERVLDPG